MRSNSTQLLKGIALLLAGSLQALAAVSNEQAARLGAELTPLGAQVAANADGSIPAWNGGITSAPAGYTPGMHHPDPYAGDSVKFTITGANADQYKEMLSPGHLALLAAYPTYKMPVYPTRRSASNPQSVYDATKANATTANLESDGNTVQNAIGGIPFPIPQDGQEAIWNHIMRFRGIAALRLTTQAAPTRGGSYTLVKFKEEFLFNYFMPGMTAAALDNVAFYFKQEVTEPARLAGSILIVHETIDQVKEPRRAWVYNVGQRRVRRAPNVAYDNPGTAADGMRTSDQLDMFNGAINRFTWELKGKQEMIMPYNSYKLHSDSLKYSDILKPLHINQDLTRYELHRVWVVEANLKPGTSHIYPRRVFYIDEDSWQILAVDQYDARGQLWRISEAHCINYYDQLTFWSTVEVHTDLLAGRYIALGMDNEEKMYDFTIKRTPQDFTPASLRMEGIR
jgi:hypothetical protein